MGRRPQFTRKDLSDAALQVADEEGLEAVGIRSVARVLGVTPMSLYRYVTDKADLRDGLVESVLTSIRPPEATLGWEQKLREGADAMRAAVLEHPSIAPLLLSRPVTTPGAVALRNQVVDLLRKAGLCHDNPERGERLFSTAILGFVVSEASGRFRNHDQTVLDEDFRVLVDSVLRELQR